MQENPNTVAYVVKYSRWHRVKNVSAGPLDSISSCVVGAIDRSCSRVTYLRLTRVYQA